MYSLRLSFCVRNFIFYCIPLTSTRGFEHFIYIHSFIHSFISFFQSFFLSLFVLSFLSSFLPSFKSFRRPCCFHLQGLASVFFIYIFLSLLSFFLLCFLFSFLCYYSLPAPLCPTFSFLSTFLSLSSSLR